MKESKVSLVCGILSVISLVFVLTLEVVEGKLEKLQAQITALEEQIKSNTDAIYRLHPEEE